MCDFVRSVCEPESSFNFYAFHYCHDDERLSVIIPLGVRFSLQIIIILVVFYLLGTTADGYMAPSLEQISNKLGFSEQLAGVTFLALANGAPDVIGAIAAASSDSGGTTMAVGALVGAAIFVGGVVSAVVIIFAKQPIKLQA